MARRYVALDVEATGPIPTLHDIVAVGWCIGDDRGNISERGLLVQDLVWPQEGEPLPPNWEARCWDQFWSRQVPAVLQLYQRGDRVPRSEFPRVIDAFLARLDATEPEGGTVLLSDCPDFDIGLLDALLGTALHAYGPRYARGDSTKRRDVSDPGEINAGIRESFADATAEEEMNDQQRAPEDTVHNTMYDAEFVYRYMINVNKARRH